MTKEAGAVDIQGLEAALQLKMRGRNVGIIAKGLYGIEVIKLYLKGATRDAIFEYLNNRGIKVSKGAYESFRRRFIKTLPPELVDHYKKQLVVDAHAPPKVVDTKDYSEESTTETLKGLVNSIARRITAVQISLDGQVGTSRTDEIFVKLLDQYAKLRKDLERERLESEVEKAKRQMMEDVATLALNFISTEDKKREFAEKLTELERKQNS